MPMFRQMRYFTQDISRILGNNKLRLLIMWLSPVFWPAWSGTASQTMRASSESLQK